MVIASPNKALFVVPERKFSQEKRTEILKGSIY